MSLRLLVLRRAALLALLGSVVASCGGEARRHDRPHLLLISVDTLRSDHLGCYGYERDTSPRLDALAARGTVFADVVSTSSWTLPSHASMLTGLYPAFHGLQDDGVTLAEDVPTLAERLRDAGYATVATVAHVYVSSQFGLERGFDRFADELIRGGTRNPVASEVVDRFLEQLDELGDDRPVFGFVHFFDPHWDYTAPGAFRHAFTDPDYAGSVDGTYRSLLEFVSGRRAPTDADRRQMVGYYDGEIAYWDDQLGRLLDALDERGMLANTVVAVTSDHGEEFLDHGELGHGRTLFVEQLGVPLVVAGHPALDGGGRRAGLVSPLDVAPTFLELAGAPTDGLHGRSLLAPPDPDRAVVAESIRLGNPLRALRRGDHKVVRRPDEGDVTYFDVARDPREQAPLDADPTGGALLAALDDYAGAADTGWRLRVAALAEPRMTLRGTLSTAGVFTDARRYFSGNLLGSEALFHHFDVRDDGHTLSFLASIATHQGEIVFETDPPDAAVRFELEISCDEGPCGVFVGAGDPVADPAGFELRRDDPRLRARPPHASGAMPGIASGVWIRAVPPRAGAASELSDDALRALGELGYVDEGDDGAERDDGSSR